MSKSKERLIIESYIDKNESGISFVELENELKRNNIYHKGDYWLCYKQYKHVYIWVNMSKEFLNAIIDLVNECKIKMLECSTLIYMADGKAPDLPLARGNERSYKLDHWLPMEISKDKW